MTVPLPEPPRRPWTDVPPVPPVVPPLVPVVPGPVEGGGGPAGDPYARLLDRRTVFVRGRLDDEAASLVVAQLMTLDGAAADEVTVIVNSGGGPVAAVFPVLDTVALMRGPVATLCIGQAVGTAAAVVAAGTAGRRRATAGARLSLRLEEELMVSGGADDLARQADEARDRRRQLGDVVARLTGRPPAAVADAFEHGPVLAASEAVAAGLLDEVAARA